MKKERIWKEPPGYLIQFDSNDNVEHELQGYEIIEKVNNVYIVSEKIE